MIAQNTSLEAYFEETKIPLRLGLVNETGWPMVVSLWYLFEGGFLYCATPQSAKVVTSLTSDPRCAYEVASDQPPYCGVRGRALATIDSVRGLEILEQLLLRYLGTVDNSLAQKLLTRSVPEVAIRLELQSSYTWNFTDRMTSSLQHQPDKICPD